MKEIIRVIKTLIGYAQRPDLYPELGRKFVKNTVKRSNAYKGKEKTAIWAASKAVALDELLNNLFGVSQDKFREEYQSVLQEAARKQRRCPVKMGGPGALELIFYACEFTAAKHVLETGVAYGWSSLASLLSLEKRNGTLYSSDMPYLGQNSDQYVGVVVPQFLKSNWKLYRTADRESLPKIFNLNSNFDVVHYDSDKSYDGRMWAYEMMFLHLREGGVFISDDISDNSAYQDFCEKNNIETSVIEFEGKFVGIFIK